LLLAVSHGGQFYDWLFIDDNDPGSSTSFNSNQANQLEATMNRVLCFWIFCALANLAPICADAMESTTQGAQLGPGDHTLVLQVGDRERRYVIHVPESYDGKHAVAVVIMFHGGGGNAKNAIAETGWTSKADRVGFLVAFPEGSPPNPAKPSNFRTNPQTWNDASNRFPAEKMNIDDGAFTRAVIDDLSARFNVDARRVFLVGFSNGSSLVYRLGVELSDRVAAIAPVASSGLRLADPLQLQQPVSLIAIHGLDDRLNPVEGGDVKGLGRSDIDTRPPIKNSVERWARMLACPSKPELFLNENKVSVLRYGPCTKQSEVVFYTIEDTGHTWPGGVSILPRWLVGKTTNKLKATDVIWEFFQNHPKPN
jgi:polyhydroxybutyrate depolymerase